MCKKSAFKKPVVKKNCIAIACGFLKAAVVITPGGPDDEYIEMQRSSPWLCEAVSGVHHKSGPLKRTKLLDVFKQGLNKGEIEESSIAATGGTEVENPPDKMKMLFANMPAPAAKTLGQVQARAARKTHAKYKGQQMDVKRKGVGSFAKTVELPLHFGGQELTEWRLWHKHGCDSVWLHIDDLVAAVEYLHEEAQNQGVLPMAVVETEEPEHEDPAGSISWDRRDYYWQAKVRGSVTNTLHRKTFKVPMKNENGGGRLTTEEFDAARALAHQAALEWIEEVK